MKPTPMELANLDYDEAFEINRRLDWANGTEGELQRDRLRRVPLNYTDQRDVDARVERIKIRRERSAEVKRRIHGVLAPHEKLKARELLHKLWGNASAGDYDKDLWNKFSVLAERAFK